MEENTQLTMDLGQYQEAKEEIKKDLGGIVKGFVRIGWQLSRIDKSQAYKLDGYNSLAEFAQAEYDMTPSGVSRFVSVYEKYSDGDTPELKEQYRNFKFAQLTEMLQIPEEEHEMFRPEAKRDAIRDYKAYEKENESDPENLTRWLQEPDDNLGKAIMEFFRTNKDIMNELFGSSAYPEDIKTMAEIINPSGNAHFRHKTIFIMMYEYSAGLMINEFGSSPRKMTWAEFFEKVKDIFRKSKEGETGQGTGPITWESCFSDQIPGQDSIENHPEYMPVPENSENPEKRGNSPSQTDSEGNEKTPAADAEMKPQETPAVVVENAVPVPAAAVEPVPDEINGHQIIGFAPAQKIDAYDREQAKIDRETKKKLEEMEDAEKMAHLPSDEGPKVYQIRLAASLYDDVAAGRKTFELTKNDRDYRVGQILEMMEFNDGRHTGRVIHADIVYMVEGVTGLQDGYCILGIAVRDYN